MDRLLAEALPEAADGFVRAYGSRAAKRAQRGAAARGADDLLPCRQLALVVEQLRDASWSAALGQRQARSLLAIFERLQPLLRALLCVAAELDVPSALGLSAMGEAAERDGEVSGTAVAAVFGSFMLGLEVASFYLALASCLGAPPTLVVEELTSAAVGCLRQALRQLVLPLLTPPAADGRRGTAVARAPALPFEAQETEQLCGAAAGALRSLHEFLCRHRLSDELLHQVLHASLGAFFTSRPHFALCAAAEEVVTTVFCRFDLLRPSLLQELVARLPKLPTGRRARQLLLPASEDSPDFGLTPISRLLIRLVQSTCLPLRETPGVDVDFASVLERRAAAQTVTSQLVGGILQRLLQQPAGAFAADGGSGGRPPRAAARDEESRIILDELVDQLILAMFRPLLPGALALLRTMLLHAIQFCAPDRPTGAVVRESAVRLMSKILAAMWSQKAQVDRGFVRLPRWDQPPAPEHQEERRLQHLALRVSLEQGRDMPWTAAAKAVEAWDAELYLPEGGGGSGLARLTDDLVFMHLTLAHLEDERAGAARFAPAAQGDGAWPPLSSAVFSSGHPVHAWSFVVCEWAEAAAAAARAKAAEAAGVGHHVVSGGVAAAAAAGAKRRRLSRKSSGALDGQPADAAEEHRQDLERFLAGAWTAKNMLTGEGCGGRSSGGRRVLLAFTVYKAYRQLRTLELAALREICLDCLLRQANSGQASLRRSATRALSDLVAVDTGVLAKSSVQDTIGMRLGDESSWVRQVALELLGRALDGAEAAGEDGEEPAPAAAAADEQTRQMLLRFHATVRGRINDTSVVVRRQAAKILSAFLLAHPDHPDVVAVAHDLMRRSSDSESLRNLVLGTFELLWFMDEEPSPRAALQLARVVDAGGAMGMAPAEVLRELLRRFQHNVSSRRHSEGFDLAVRRWTTLLLSEFVQPTLSAPEKPGAAAPSEAEAAKLEEAARSVSVEELLSIHRRALLSTLEAFATAQPQAMVPHLRPLTVYLALDEGSSAEEQWVASKVCRILAATLPRLTSQRRGLMDHRQVQTDLQALIRSQPSSGVHEAVRCLCVVIKFVTGDLGQVLVHLNGGVPGISRLCTAAQSGKVLTDRLQLLYLSRQIWILASILETLRIDDYLKPEAAEAGSGGEADARRVLSRSLLRFDLVGGSVAETVADLLARLYAVGHPMLRGVVVTCLGFFLRGQREYARDRRLADIFATALGSRDLSLCHKALEALAGLLAHFAREAEAEVRPEGLAEAAAARLAGGGPVAAVEAAQPLSIFADAALAHLSLAATAAPAASPEAAAALTELRMRLRTEALSVVRLLHQQGLVNPMLVLPKVFSLCFSEEPLVSEPAVAMLKDMLDVRPALLINRMDEAFREAFLAMYATGQRPRLGGHLSDAQVGALGELYAERFRRQKPTRESFLRRLLRELFKPQTDRGSDRFAELTAAVAPMPAVKPEPGSEEDAPRRRRRLARTPAEAVKQESLKQEGSSANGEDLEGSDPLLASLTLQQQHQVLYAQFVAAALCSLPFAFEGEPLLVVFECNHHLSLHAGAFVVAAPGGTSAAAGPAEGSKDLFGDALSIAVCIAVKSVMKAAYGLSDDQCARFDPKDSRQERLRPGAGRGAGEDAGGPLRAGWPAGQFRRLARPLLENAAAPARLAEYVVKLAEEDPWDTSRLRYALAVERLEGRGTKRGRGAVTTAAAAGRGAGRARGRGRGRGRGKKVPPPDGKEDYSPAEPAAEAAATEPEPGEDDSTHEETSDAEDEDYEDIG